MIRKSVLATLMALVLFASQSTWAHAKTTTNFNRSDMALFADEDTSGSDDLKSGKGSESLVDAAVPQASQALGTANGESMSNFGPSSGTIVGNRALELRDEVLRLRSSVNLNANEFSILRANGAAGAVQYHSTVAAITARLQNGTTRGNPILLRQWEEAEGSLNEVTSSLNRLNSLQTSVAADASLASYMLESIQAAFLLSGAVDEDHDQLKLLRDEVSRLVVQLDYLRNQVAGDIQRQTTYLTTERANLQSLAFAITRGELLGNSVANRPVIVNPSPVMMLPQGPVSPYSEGAPARTGASLPSAAPLAPVTSGRIGPAPMSPREYMSESGQYTESPPALPEGNAAVAPTTGRLLVLIRYNQPYVEYEQQLSAAVHTALQRKPDTSFSVIAVTPASGDPAELATMQEAAQRNAEDVNRSLVQLGLAPSRVTLSSTQSQDAKTPEVHIYVK